MTLWTMLGIIMTSSSFRLRSSGKEGRDVLESSRLEFFEKKWFLWAKGSIQTRKNHGAEWKLTYYSRLGIYSVVPPWMYSRNSVAVAARGSTLIKHIIPRNISDMILKTIPISTRIIRGCATIRPPQWKKDHCRSKARVKG